MIVDSSIQIVSKPPFYLEAHSMQLSVDQLTEEIQQFIAQKHNITVPKEKLKGVAFSALEQSGKLTKEDKYKTYAHVGKMLEFFNGAFGENTLVFEDMESFTGNLFFAMRVATSRPLGEIQTIIEKYDRPNVDAKELQVDLVRLQDSCKKNMNDTWNYIENTQVAGAGIIVNKILRSLLFKAIDQK